MKIKKALLPLMFALSTLTSTAGAEQAVAEQYREMFRSGNFYVEYQTVQFTSDGETVYSMPDVVAAQSGRRIVKDMDGKAVMHPKAIFQDQKYYRFKSESEILMLDQAQAGNPSLNPNEGWQNIKQVFSLPEELSVFCWDDPYRDGYYVQRAPRYNGSSKRMAEKIDPEISLKNAKKGSKSQGGLFGGVFGGLFGGGKSGKSTKDSADMVEYDCDQYITDITNLNGEVVASTVYNMLYLDGNLIAVQKYFICDGMEDMLSQIIIRKITADIPADAFQIERESKIYAAGVGDMNDLLESPVQIGTMGGGSNAK